MEKLTIVKIGGNVVDDEKSLDLFLSAFATLPGLKLLVHGGGKLATDLAGKLSIPQTMVDGRRVTDAETLRVATMVYAGLVNKTIVSKLQAKGVQAFGLTGADGDAIRAVKREKGDVDFGFVGDVCQVNQSILEVLFTKDMTPVMAPITHDGKGQLLNTNADTIAQELATALSSTYEVHLLYTFEKSGVLLDLHDEDSVIPVMIHDDFQRLKKEGKIFAGMIPKLENAFSAIDAGVSSVILGRADRLLDLRTGKAGTTLRRIS
jgi:acetylglutamate kinase